jgi:hypothetical protein
MSKHVEPSVSETAFSCPHCGALTTQYWLKLYAESLPAESPTPNIPKESDRKGIIEDTIKSELKTHILGWMDKMLSGLVFLQEGGSTAHNEREAYNLHLTKCFNCKKIAVWVNDRLLFPRAKTGVQPNLDLPEDIVRDFEEAREIADASPRGARSSTMI